VLLGPWLEHWQHWLLWQVEFEIVVLGLHLPGLLHVANLVLCQFLGHHWPQQIDLVLRF
jgi:hypothetical protein